MFADFQCVYTSCKKSRLCGVFQNTVCPIVSKVERAGYNCTCSGYSAAKSRPIKGLCGGASLSVMGTDFCVLLDY